MRLPFTIDPDWRHVLRYAWSVRLILAAALFSGLEAALGFVGAFLPIPPSWLALLSFAVTAAAFVARIVAQPKMESRREK